MTTPRPGLLFHFTHIDNLPTILSQGALLCDTMVCAEGLLKTEAGHRGIKGRRRTRAVTCDPGGFVADYVPFYFAARSPMMLTLKSGRVPTFTGDHRDLVYLLTDVATVVASGARFAISDRNATVAVADFTNDVRVLGDLTQAKPRADFVDWPLMNETYWHDTAQYPDRMERRMAEFLVHRRVPLEHLIGTAVQSNDRKAIVERMFAEAGLALRVVVRSGWYYS